MGTPEKIGPETAAVRFWTSMLTAGGFTSLPRWTLTPAPGTAVHEADIPAALTTELAGLARGLKVTLTSVLLSAHVKVLSSLSGESQAGCGYIAVPGGFPLPCHLTAETPSWRALLLATDQACSSIAAHHQFPVDVLRSRLRLPAMAPESVFDPYGTRDGPADSSTPLRVTVAASGGRYRLRLHYRTDVLDMDCAARIAGYHLTALELIAADPDAAPGPQSLVSSAELHHQLTNFTGPRRDLPEVRAHELFEQRAHTSPDAVAAVQDNQRWTYGELNVRANRLAHALLAQGLRREEPVAVVSERNLGWMAAVLAVLKAGGAYMPIEPHFPAHRITTMLTRSSCRFVLMESGSTATLDRALDRLAEIRTLPIETAYDNARDDRNPRVGVPADSLAYIYFTSGSTGDPKGVMCEHAGLLNHLYAKIDDLSLGDGETIAQTAPQCFDISLWQLLAGPLAGGRTLLVEQEAVMDIERFLDVVIAQRATVIQVVPSYLDAVLSALERRPRDLPDLRCVSVTGEAVKKELVARWFASMPGIRLVNAYGLTETCDDTTHEIMDQPPDSDRIPLGRPVGNVRAYVLGSGLEPVPLGAPGELVFSGICVGRGYVNDPERTRLAFGTDPYHPGSRIYRSGDYGRWLPNGKLEFLGRHDSQVKIRGFRIELAEIENALLRAPGIHDAAVVAAHQPGGATYLAAFYTAPTPQQASGLQDLLSASLPGYMVPSVFRRLERLPVTANGKTDIKALQATAAAYCGETVDGNGPPDTPAERRLATVWAQVLGTPMDRIRRQDRFFDMGGTSLSALRAVVALDRDISFADLAQNPSLASLAHLIESRSQRPGTP